MSAFRGRVVELAEQQHGAVAFWQLRRSGLSGDEAKAALAGLRRVHRGVCAVGDLDELGWMMAAVLSAGPGAAISHASAVQLLGLRPWEPGDIHVSVPRGGGRSRREGVVIHRRTRFERSTCEGIPVTSPALSLADARLQPHALYRALEEAEKQQLALTLPRNGVFELRRRVAGRTRSDAEARFILLCHEHGLKLPRVNHRLNGFETDFHWRDARLVAEVDGFEYHRDRAAFEEDRRRGVCHRIAGFEVLRFSALQVQHEPARVVAAVVAAAPSLAVGSPQVVHGRPREARIRL